MHTVRGKLLLESRWKFIFEPFPTFCFGKPSDRPQKETFVGWENEIHVERADLAHLECLRFEITPARKKIKRSWAPLLKDDRVAGGVLSGTKGTVAWGLQVSVLWSPNVSSQYFLFTHSLDQIIFCTGCRQLADYGGPTMWTLNPWQADQQGHTR